MFTFFVQLIGLFRYYFNNKACSALFLTLFTVITWNKRVLYFEIEGSVTSFPSSQFACHSSRVLFREFEFFADPTYWNCLASEFECSGK